jgi:hypothetical protein
MQKEDTMFQLDISLRGDDHREKNAFELGPNGVEFDPIPCLPSPISELPDERVPGPGVTDGNATTVSRFGKYVAVFRLVLSQTADVNARPFVLKKVTRNGIRLEEGDLDVFVRSIGATGTTYLLIVSTSDEALKNKIVVVIAKLAGLDLAGIASAPLELNPHL